MIGSSEKVLPILRLKYRKGDLIFKQGDYGLSIYKVLSGRVNVHVESNGRKICSSTPGPGEVIGDGLFLKRDFVERTFSARALEDCELEVWHIERLRNEYHQMPASLKYIMDQIMERLQLTKDLRSKLQDPDPPNNQTSDPEKIEARAYYRKELDQPCSYTLANSPQNTLLSGKVRNLSFGGIGLEIETKNTKTVPHHAGNEFDIHTVLPNGKELQVKARIVWLQAEWTPGKCLLGLEFAEMNPETRKTIGFFLMP